MGYYTKFYLTVIKKDSKEELSAEEHEKFEEEISEATESEWNLFDDEQKWYDWETNMIGYSKDNPDYIFILEGHGEEGGDYWKSYFSNGNSETVRGEVTYPSFERLVI